MWNAKHAGQTKRHGTVSGRVTWTLITALVFQVGDSFFAVVHCLVQNAQPAGQTERHSGVAASRGLQPMGQQQPLQLSDWSPFESTGWLASITCGLDTNDKYI